MTFLEGFVVVGSSATVFGFIVGIFSFFNGRITRKEISRLIIESRESTERLIEAADKRRSEDTKYLTELISQISRL